MVVEGDGRSAVIPEGVHTDNVQPAVRSVSGVFEGVCKSTTTPSADAGTEYGACMLSCPLPAMDIVGELSKHCFLMKTDLDFFPKKIIPVRVFGV